MADLFRAVKLKPYQIQMVVQRLPLRFFSSFEKISPACNFQLKNLCEWTLTLTTIYKIAVAMSEFQLHFKSAFYSSSVNIFCIECFPTAS